MGRARSLGSVQQSVCLSCHDGHLSCPQSVWKEFFFFLMREEGRKGEGKEGRRRKEDGRVRVGYWRRKGRDGREEKEKGDVGEGV